MDEMLVDVKIHFLVNLLEKIYVKQENKDVDIRPHERSGPNGSASLNSSCQSPFCHNTMFGSEPEFRQT